MHTLPHAITALLVALMLTAQPGPAAAWGPEGHQDVGAIADQLIAGTPTAKKVRQILGGTLQTAAVWADCARGVEGSTGQWAYPKPGVYKDCAIYENPASKAAMVAFVDRNASRCGFRVSSTQCRHKAYHFVDLPLAHTHYDPALPGTAPNDLVHATGAAISVLKGAKSAAPFNIQGQREALRLLTHYVGDLHQPLHVGAIYLDDAGASLDPANPKDAHDHGNAGGNQISIEGRNLHALWDDIPAKMHKDLLGGAGRAQARQVATQAGNPDQWPTEWASDTAAEASKAFEGLTIGGKASTPQGVAWPATAPEPAYRQAREALQHQQLLKAGARLAQLLTTLFP